MVIVDWRQYQVLLSTGIGSFIASDGDDTLNARPRGSAGYLSRRRRIANSLYPDGLPDMRIRNVHQSKGFILQT